MAYLSYGVILLSRRPADYATIRALHPEVDHLIASTHRLVPPADLHPTDTPQDRT